MKAWSKYTDSGEGTIDKLYPDATNTGILTQSTPVLDIDILDPEAAGAVEMLVKHRFEDERILTRIGMPPKRAILFRTDRPFKKINVILIAGNGSEKIEFLCDGQQAVVDGIHPDTHQPYRWDGGKLGAVKHDDLPTSARPKRGTWSRTLPSF